MLSRLTPDGVIRDRRLLRQIPFYGSYFWSARYLICDLLSIADLYLWVPLRGDRYKVISLFNKRQKPTRITPIDGIWCSNAHVKKTQIITFIAQDQMFAEISMLINRDWWVQNGQNLKVFNSRSNCLVKCLVQPDSKIGFKIPTTQQVKFELDPPMLAGMQLLI